MLLLPQSSTPWCFRTCLGTKDLDLLLDGLELLGTRLAGTATDDELRAELPASGDAPSLGNLLVNEGVVMLEVGAETLELERGPDGVLQHSAALGGPGREVVLVDGDVLLVALDDVLVLEEKNLQAKAKDSNGQ